MAEKKTTKKQTTTKNDTKKWATTGGAMKPVNVTKIEWANKPKGK